VAELTGRATREREGYAVQLLPVLQVRDPNFHDLLMRGSKLEFHVYLARNVWEERENDYNAPEQRYDARQATAVSLEPSASGTHDSTTIPVRVSRALADRRYADDRPEPQFHATLLSTKPGVRL
jgi:hypothetical protein